MLMKQYDAAKLDESKDAAIIQVVEPAIEPDQKSTPKRALIVLLFTIVGFFAGCLLAWLGSWRDIVQSDPDFAEKVHDLKFALLNKDSAKASL